MKEKALRQAYARSVRRCRAARLWTWFLNVCGEWVPPVISRRIEPMCVAPIIPHVMDSNGDFVRHYTWTEMRMILTNGFKVRVEE